MKRSSLAAFAVTMVLFVTVPGAVGAQGASARPAGTAIAVLDVAQVFEQHNRFKARMTAIKGDIDLFEASVRDTQKRMNGVRESVKDFKPGSPEFKQAEEQLASMQADLQVQMQRKRREFLEREAKVYHEAYMEMSDAVSRFANHNGIGLVIRFSSEPIDVKQRDSVLQGVNRAVVFQRNLDITAFIVQELNRGFPTESAGRVGPQIPVRNR